MTKKATVTLKTTTTTAREVHTPDTSWMNIQGGPLDDYLDNIEESVEPMMKSCSRILDEIKSIKLSIHPEDANDAASNIDCHFGEIGRAFSGLSERVGVLCQYTQAARDFSYFGQTVNDAKGEIAEKMAAK